jgi:methyl-accepting chemotaxis protein
MREILNKIFRINAMSLRIRIMFYFSLFALLAGSLFGILTYSFAKEIITSFIYKQIEIVRDERISDIKNYFQNKESGILVLANTSEVKEGILEFKSAFSKLERNLGASKAEDFLKQSYISNNPNQIGKKDLLDYAPENNEYNLIHKKFHPFFRSYIKKKDYYDLFLVDAEDGRIIYSVFKEKDYATNLLTGEYKNSNLGILFKKIKEQRNSDIIYFADFDKYAPSGNEPAAFVGVPIKIQNKVEGILLLQLSIRELNSKMNDTVWKTETGESFLVGADNLMRTDSKFITQSTILKKKVATDSVNLALKGEKGIRESINYRGQEVISAYSPIDIWGTKFAILTEIQSQEANKDLDYVLRTIIISIVSLIVLIMVISYIVAVMIGSSISESIGLLSGTAKEFAVTLQQEEKTSSVQSSSVNETTSTMAELASSAKNTEERSSFVTNLAGKSLELAKQGGESIHQMMDSMEELKDRVHATSEQIMQLSDKINQISSIISLVSDIANETNMLALNAAVEAARAGEHGKGFAVVAVEIRKLADESKKSASRISSIISDIKKETDTTVMVTEEGTKKVEQSLVLGKESVESFNGISNSISGVFESIEQISLNMQQQAYAISEVLKAMNMLNVGSRETASGISHAKSQIDRLNFVINKLSQLVDGK